MSFIFVSELDSLHTMMDDSAYRFNR